MCESLVSTAIEPFVCPNGKCPLNYPQYEWIRAADFLASSDPLTVVGKDMFPDAGCVGLYEDITSTFSISRALEIIQCPYPLKKNSKASLEGVTLTLTPNP